MPSVTASDVGDPNASPAVSVTDPAITCRAVAKTFTSDTGSVVALEDISLEVRRGELVALLGPSGCGKSTLLSILAGLTTPNSGEVVVDGEQPRPRSDVGMMFQDSLLFPWRSVLKNVMLPAELLDLDRDEAAERARELLRMVGLDGWEDRHVWELSGGMRQRVALARVLLPDPDILLLDEPFGALDEMTRESLDVEMMRIAQETAKTVVLVTHNIYEAIILADRVFVLSPRPGRLAGTVDVPLRQPRTIEDSGTSLFADKVGEARRLLGSGTVG